LVGDAVSYGETICAGEPSYAGLKAVRDEPHVAPSGLESLPGYSEGFSPNAWQRPQKPALYDPTQVEFVRINPLDRENTPEVSRQVEDGGVAVARTRRLSFSNRPLDEIGNI
jgi:hypothetical protein